jgi:transposase InsO family protein
MYLAVVIDLYSRAVIGWSMQPIMSRKIVCDALVMAIKRRGYFKDLLFHSDRGSQYCSKDFQNILKKYGIRCSMSRKANCWDNAIAESFFHTIKSELIYGTKYKTRKIAKEDIFHYIEVYYNKIRRHSSIGSIAPIVFEEKFKSVT